MRDFWPRWRHRKIYFAYLHSQKKGNNQFKNKNQPQLSENQTVWNYNNQGIKEKTFTQTGRRGTDRQPGRRGHAGKVAAGRLGIPTIAYGQTRRSNWGVRQLHNLGFQHGEIKPQNLWL